MDKYFQHLLRPNNSQVALSSKSDEEASSTTYGGSINSSFIVSSVSPADGASGIIKTGATITFGDDVSLKNTNMYSTTAWTTSST